MESTSTMKQWMHRLEIHKVKGLKNLNISFASEGLTAILGPNGSGKSTILHLLACAYNPLNREGCKDRRDDRFPDFFLPISFKGADAFSWEGTEFTYVYAQEIDGVCKGRRLHIRKDGKFWMPGKKSYRSVRKDRWVSYLGIETCVPDIEKEKLRSHIDYLSVDDPKIKILDDAKYILGKEYTEYSICGRRDRRRNKRVRVGDIQYSSLSMGAGEQRVFTILEEVYKAHKHGLILIDELDLLLHQASLARLIEKLVAKAREKHLQIIFTAHNQSILNLRDVDFYHICHIGGGSLCLKDSDPRALELLTGDVQTDLEIYVEDKLSKALVKQICLEEKCARRVSVETFGAIDNAFTLVATTGLIPKRFNGRRLLFVLDGDKYRTNEARLQQLKKRLAGQGDEQDDLRMLLLTRLKQFSLPEKEKPEKYYYSLIKALPNEDFVVSDAAEGLLEELRLFNPAGVEHHKWFSKPIENLGMSRDEGYALIAELLSKSDRWHEITSEVRAWIRGHISKPISEHYALIEELLIKLYEGNEITSEVRAWIREQISNPISE